MLEVVKLFSSKVYLRESTLYLYDFSEKEKNDMLLPFLKRLRIPEVMSKPNDSRKNEKILEQVNTFFKNCLVNSIRQ